MYDTDVRNDLLRVFFTFFYLSVFVISVPQHASAATLLISPAIANYHVGETFSQNVIVSTDTQSINAVSGTLSFPPNILRVVSVSTINSIITIWPQNPTFSNETGKISFEGIVPNPGYNGTVGKVLTIKYIVKAAGPVAIKFGDASVLANNGQGTNILTTTNGVTGTASEKTNPSTVEISAAPEASSSIDTSSIQWFSTSTGKAEPQFVEPVALPSSQERILSMTYVSLLSFLVIFFIGILIF